MHVNRALYLNQKYVKSYKITREEIIPDLNSMYNIYCAPVEFAVQPDCRPPARYFPGGITVNPGGLQYSFSICKAEEGGDAVDTPAGDNAVPERTGSPGCERMKALVYRGKTAPQESAWAGRANICTINHTIICF